jgi:hypothetical protein
MKFYGLSDTLNSLSEELYFYNNDKLISKAVLFSQNSDTAVKEIKYNTRNKVSSINYYKLGKHGRDNEYSIEFSYNERGQLTLEEYKGMPGKVSYSFNYSSKGLLIEQKIYQTSDIRKITFEYDSLGRLSRKDEMENYIIYKYWQGLLVREEVYNKRDELSYEVLYKYENGLNVFVDNGASLQKNIYVNGKLHKRKEVYNRGRDEICGTGPLSDPSSIQVYEYYE